MPVIEISDISAGYGKCGQCQVLYNISLTMEKGKFVSVVGPNGCGKSTLLKTIIGMLELTNGKVLIDGSDIATMDKRSIARTIAYLAQGKSVPDMTVEQMVLHGRFPHLTYPRRYRKHDREIAARAMNQMGITEMADNSVASLSGGMRQNAYIAMALSQDADYILMDEPTTYLDIANRFKLMETIKGLVQSGKGVVAVLHDLTLAMEYSDYVVVMRDGNIIMTDTPDIIFNSKVIDDVFGIKLQRSQRKHGYAYYYEKHGEDIENG